MDSCIENAHVVGHVYNVVVILDSQTHSDSCIETDNCCVCGTCIDGEFLHPSKCFGEHRILSHKICKNCWFKPNGFGTEGVNHTCPGCINGLPLGKKIKQSVPNDSIIIDLTDGDSDCISDVGYDSIYSGSYGIDSGYDSYFDDIDDQYCEIDIR